MPLYEWVCDQCGEQMEVFRSVADYQQPPDHQHPMRRVLSVPYAIGDLPAYTATTGDMVGKPIEGRKAHREFLKRNRLIEVGNEPLRSTKQMRKTTNREETRMAIKDAIAQHCVPDIQKGGLKERHGSR